MSPPLSLPLSTQLCFPRVSGDEPAWRAGMTWVWKFSPRERG